MRFVFYLHSLVSDWNHGNAHFMRGVLRELVHRGHEVTALEPADGWSRANLLAQQGEAAIARFEQDFPELVSTPYGPDFDHEAALADADAVLVHEWTAPDLVAEIGRLRRHADFTLLFHDTHHRAVSASADIEHLPLDAFDGVLAFGEALRERYRRLGWGRNVFVWHEAADTRLFRPMPEVTPTADLIWIGNWGDGERTAELEAFLFGPAARLGISGTVHGVRYPESALEAVSNAGLTYGGWIANADVPLAFARHLVTMHVPRRPYVEALPGIPTIRMFEALACGIPLLCAPWRDTESLFRPEDYVPVRNEAEMTASLRDLLGDPARRDALSRSGLETIRAHHTCAHRVEELMTILGAVATARVIDQLPARSAAQ